MTGTALIAGRGALPRSLAAAMAEPPLVCAPEGISPEALMVDVAFRIERLVPFLDLLAARGITHVVFAGAMERPRLDPSLFDPATAQIVPRLLQAMAQGDDATLRAVVALFEEFDLTVIGAADIAPSLVPGDAVLAGAPGEADHADAARAATIVDALGAVDVGQGAVVQQGLCLAVETLSGTDAMLASVAALPDRLRPDPLRGKGLLYKSPKPGQDRRIDMPTIGPDTVRQVSEAGLGGLAWQAHGVICLDLPLMIRLADDAGLFLWSRAR